MTSFEMGSLIARAWSDEAFMSKLLTSPSDALKEYGIVLPLGVTLRVHANSQNEMHIVIPEAPSGLTLSGKESSEDRGSCWLPCRGNNSW